MGTVLCTFDWWFSSVSAPEAWGFSPCQLLFTSSNLHCTESSDSPYSALRTTQTPKLSSMSSHHHYLTANTEDSVNIIENDADCSFLIEEEEYVCMLSEFCVRRAWLCNIAACFCHGCAKCKSNHYGSREDTQCSAINGLYTTHFSLSFHYKHLANAPLPSCEITYTDGHVY